MAPPVYSLRIFGGSPSVASGLVGPIVPSGMIYVVRDIDAAASTGANGNELIVFNGTLGLLWVAFVTAATGPNNWQWRGRQVYGPGERVGVQSFNGTWDVSISGYQLTLP